MIQEMECCTLCPRGCGAERMHGKNGYCGVGNEIKVARASLHMWEEPCISGKRGSGAVFFAGCNLGCVFCQNHNIASGMTGKEISVERLSEIFLSLQEQGANNINLVTGTHYVPQIVRSLDLAKQQGLRIPIVYNTGAYETVENIKRLEGYVDIYLPDLKYMDSELSKEYSHAPDYFSVASAAIEEMVRQVGIPLFVREEFMGRTEEKQWYDVASYQSMDEEGISMIMRRGVIVRHLLLPGCSADSKKIIRYLLQTYQEHIFISIMNQYTPLSHVSAYPEMMRKVTPEEYEDVVNYAIELGIENGFVQEGDVAEESFIPEFDGTGV
ncbi:MAG: radical SAM protein [Lachnospiraceae bacterium]|nr:radical SAM protein [Lachnospiraceae bacterium]